MECDAVGMSHWRSVQSMFDYVCVIVLLWYAMLKTSPVTTTIARVLRRRSRMAHAGTGPSPAQPGSYHTAEAVGGAKELSVCRSSAVPTVSDKAKRQLGVQRVCCDCREVYTISWCRI